MNASNEFWKLCNSLFPKLLQAKDRERIRKKIPQFRSIRESLYKNNVPRIAMEFGYEIIETGDIIIMSDLDHTPVSKFPPSKFRKLYESATVKVIITKKIEKGRS